MFENKLVAVMNEKVEIGVMLNALAHMCIGFGAEIGKEALRLCNYIDADANTHPHISEMPFIILKGNSSKIKVLKQEALQQSIACTDFVHTMTGGAYTEQLERTLQTKQEELIYYGIVLFGPWEKVSQLTRKFSLLR
jgi:hypothetical protein